MPENIYNPDFVKRLFNSMSSSYERMNYITSFGFSIRWRTQFLNSFPKSEEPLQVIDLLTGMGETWHATKRRLPKARLSALDFSVGMLAYAAKKNKEKFNQEICLLQQDVLQNQLAANVYDIVTCAFGLKTFDEQQLHVLAAETQRILKPGGSFSFIEVSKPANKLLSSLYGFYLGKVIPVLGKLLLGNPSEYRLLWQYTNQFGSARHATEIFRAAGLEVTYTSYFFGCATGFSGRKVV